VASGMTIAPEHRITQLFEVAITGVLPPDASTL
jgi:hypothetical protein